MENYERIPVRTGIGLALAVVAALISTGLDRNSIQESSGMTAAHPPSGVESTQQQVLTKYGNLPLSFEPNHGQTDPRVDFIARGSGYTLFLTSTEAVFSLSRQGKPGPETVIESSRALSPLRPPSTFQSVVLRMKLMDSNPRPRVAGNDELPGKAHYFIGNDSAKWRSNVPTFGRVQYANVYPGIDVAFYGNQRQLEYDFIVGPGADPRRIALRFQGADAVELDAKGALVLHTPDGAIRQAKPQIYQDVDGRRKLISGGYVRRGPSTVGFDVSAYDVSRALVIDPTLEYSTFLGGSSSDQAGGIAVDTWAART